MVKRSRDEKTGVFKKEFADEIIAECRRQYKEGLAITKISSNLGISKTHVWRLCSDINRPRAKRPKLETGIRNEYKIMDDGTVIIYLDRNNHERLETIVDKESFIKISSLSAKWYANYSKNNRSFYVHTKIKNEDGISRLIQLHRYITDCPEGMVVDHINMNTLDNRKENLRIVTDMENKQNTRKRRHNKSGIMGVYWSNTLKKWVAKIGHNKKQITIGYFNDKEEATLAYQRKRIELKKLITEANNVKEGN